MTTLVQSALARFSSSDSPEKADHHRFLISLLEPLYPLARNPFFSLPEPPTASSKAVKSFYTVYRSFLKHMVSMDDKKIPWRDLATSRRLILADNGPFGSSHLRTKEGLFSALIHCGITHNSQFLHSEQHIFFDGLDDWNTIYATSRDALEDSMDGKDMEKYFCDGCAYGVWTRRSVEHASVYAAATEAPDLTSWLLNAEFPAFTQVYKLFLKGKVNRESVFPGFGPLQAYCSVSTANSHNGSRGSLK
ncbi:hypothetical protein CPB85DRAFT_1439944 [Mucidula mucida]|nr:hypothetical protein CPB85DRAFT_1439944 [Mucidula mucida]